jgi:hypothetical protein
MFTVEKFLCFSLEVGGKFISISGLIASIFILSFETVLFLSNQPEELFFEAETFWISVFINILLILHIFTYVAMICGTFLVRIFS